MERPIEVTITIDDAALGDVNNIAERARAVGLTVSSVLDGLGIITGSIERDAIPVLAQIPGVSAVEPETGIGIAPPDSPIQ